MRKILVTPRSLTRSGHPALDALREAGYEVIFCTPGVRPSEEDLLELLPGCVGYLAGIEEISARVLEKAEDLRVISRNGTGVDNIDLDAAERLNITICRAKGANANGVAELTLGLILALVRSISLNDARLKNEQWEREKGIELQGRRLGLVGCGAIGTRVASLGTGIGMEVIAFRRHPDPSFAPDGFRWVSMDELYTQSDIISLHRPPGEKPIINRETIAKMKQGVYLVNTARAALVDADAVLEALESGQIAGLAIDVFTQEPPKDYRLVKHKRVVATPHVGGYTSESVLRATQQAVDNLLEILS